MKMSRTGSKFHRLFIIFSLPVIALTGIFYPSPQDVEAAPVACSGPAIMFGRQRWCGYFKNIGFNSGSDVRLGGIPASVDHVQEFINMIDADLRSGNAQRRTGAQFVILTMLGRGPGAPKSVSAAQWNDWVERVRSYGNISENGTTSRGENGRIDWKVWQHMPCGTTNTYYQVGQDDVAPFRDSASNSDCETADTDQFLLFRDNAGNVDYRIRRECMNPMGVLRALEQPQPDDYNLVPSITPRVGGNPVSAGVEVGETIQFTYAIQNTGRDASPSVNCTIYTNVHVGYFDERSNPPPGGGAGPGTGCPRVFNASSSSQLGPPENVIVAAGNQTICRSLFVSPASATVASRGVEVCVPVINKPYLKVYGADISVGGGQETAPDTCASNTDAAIVSWNRGSAGGYGGASVQFAAYALSQIYEVATSSGNAGPAAPTPSGLAFANTSASGNVYGGGFGSLPCIADHYAAIPSSPASFVSLAAANTSGAYLWDRPGQLNLSGSVGAGKRITLYVDGDVFVNGDISYPASWTAGDQPLLKLVVKGNIYIRNTVSRIDGVFISQKDGASGGTIYTCATSATPLVPDGNLYNTCNRKLTINGVFVANEVQFLRANGTRQLGAAGESSGSGNIAEVFNFNPVLWMAQPVGSETGPAKYDSITALPPIL